MRHRDGTALIVSGTWKPRVAGPSSPGRPRARSSRKSTAPPAPSVRGVSTHCLSPLADRPTRPLEPAQAPSELLGSVRDAGYQHRAPHPGHVSPQPRLRAAPLRPGFGAHIFAPAAPALSTPPQGHASTAAGCPAPTAAHSAALATHPAEMHVHLHVIPALKRALCSFFNLLSSVLLILSASPTLETSSRGRERPIRGGLPPRGRQLLRGNNHFVLPTSVGSLARGRHRELSVSRA